MEDFFPKNDESKNVSLTLDDVKNTKKTDEFLIDIKDEDTGFFQSKNGS